MINKPKGTMDIYGDNSKVWLYINEIIKDTCSKYNYEFIKTPTFEASDLFHRGVGETTDIVRKETYDFLDKGGRNITLKPEGTAGVIRSYIENKMYTNETSITKLYYLTPCFRYERPQAGRLREHTQFGVEVLGSINPMIDAEVISLAASIFKKLKFTNIKVKINSLGDTSSRLNYKDALIKYIEPHIDTLCNDCKDRLYKNPLRILDCKVDCDNELFLNVPSINDYLNDESVNHFNLVKKYLDSLNINYEVDTKLVRGLDYYSHTVFEIQADLEGFGAQNTLCGGGRYNNLVKTLGGPDMAGIGFGMGLERLMLALTNTINVSNKLDLYIISMTENKEYIFSLANKLREEYKIEIDYLNKNIKGQFKACDKFSSKYVVVIGDTEITSGICKLKNNSTKEEIEINIEDIKKYIKKETSY